MHLMGISVEDSELSESFSTFTALLEQLCSTLWLLLTLLFCKFVCGMGGTSNFWLNENLEEQKITLLLLVNHTHLVVQFIGLILEN